MPTHAAAPVTYSETAPERRPDRPWIVGRVTGPRTGLRLFCLPQAGGSAASFAPWRLTPPPGVELATVELPGRGVRSAEQLPATIGELADAVIDGISDEFDLPYALFGHSFGALLGYEIAVRIARRGLTPPRALLVSASRAPHTPVRKRISDLDDAGLLAWLDGFGGFPPELARYPAYLKYALGAVRRDLALTESYLGAGPVRVDCPLHVFGGADDPLVSGAQLERWRDCAAAGSTVRVLPGGHDYLFTHAPAALDAIMPALL